MKVRILGITRFIFKQPVERLDRVSVIAEIFVDPLEIAGAALSLGRRPPLVESRILEITAVVSLERAQNRFFKLHALQVFGPISLLIHETSASIGLEPGMVEPFRI